MTALALPTAPVPEWASVVSEQEYRAERAVNYSTLKKMADSPRHYRHAVDNPTSGDTSARGVLRAIHCLTLEGPEAFGEQFAVYDGAGTRASKAYKEWAAANEGKTLLKASEVEEVYAIAEAVHGHPAARRLLTIPGNSELSLRWTDGPTGMRCRGRMDRIAHGSPLSAAPYAVVDLKTLDSTDPRRVASHVARNMWDVQAAHYSDGVKSLTGSLPDYYLLVVERKAPHDVAVFHMHPESALWVGEQRRRRLLDRVAECEASGVWPGRSPDIDELTLPSWLDDTDADLILE